MLHPRWKEVPRLLAWILALLALAGCKPEPAPAGGEIEAYLADLDPPADKWGYMDTLGQIVIPAAYADAGIFSGGLTAVLKDGRWGYIDRMGNTAIPHAFKSAWAFREGRARVTGFERHGYYIRRDGSAIFSDRWEADDDFSGGLARIREGELVGFIDTSGVERIAPIYEQATRFVDGMSIVTREGLKGVIDPQGRMRVTARYDRIIPLPGAMHFLARQRDRWQLVDRSDNIVHDFQPGESVTSDGHWIAVVSSSGTYWIHVDDLTIRPGGDLTNLHPLGEGLWRAKRDERILLVRPPDSTVHPGPFDQVNTFSGGLAVFSRDGTWGYLDTTGREVTKPVFGLAWDYRDGFARAAFSDGIAFIDRRQRLAFYPPPGTVDMRDFSEGLAPVQISRE